MPLAPQPTSPRILWQRGQRNPLCRACVLVIFGAAATSRAEAPAGDL